MDKFESLSHTAWECKYHVVFIPKRRRKTLYVELRKHLGEVFRQLALQRESRVEEGHLMPDHVHMMLSIPPKYSVSQVVGYIKGKSAIHLARTYGERKKNFVGPTPPAMLRSKNGDQRGPSPTPKRAAPVSIQNSLVIGGFAGGSAFCGEHGDRDAH